MQPGESVHFSATGLREKHGGGAFGIAEIESHTGGVRLQELPGLTFDPADFAEYAPQQDVSGSGGVAGAGDQFAVSTGAQGAVDGRLVQAVDRLRSALPAPALGSLEGGFRASSFYRFPIVATCWCGRPRRHTLDGPLCEEGHQSDAVSLEERL